MPPDATDGRRRRVVVIGGGFGGLAAARKLRHTDADVVLVDRNNHHLFQPLLYQAAAGALSSSDCASPIRPYLKHSHNTTVLMAEVTEVDPERRQVVLDRGDRLDYDSLIVACGGETSYFGNDQWRQVTCGLKTLADVVDLRNRFYGALEQAERTDDPAGRPEWMTFVVVGGGPTGVEIAGQLAITARAVRSAFRRIDCSATRVILLDAGERVVSAFSPRLSKKVADNLADLGVTVREGARVTDIDERGVTYQADGESKRIDSRTVIWAAGVHPVALVDSLAHATGSGNRPQRPHQGGTRPNDSRPPRDLGRRRRCLPRRARRKAASGARDGCHPAGASRGEGHQRGRGRSIDAVQVPRQGGARGRRQGQGGM